MTRIVAEEQISRRGGVAVDVKASLASAGVDLVRDGLFLRPLDRRMEHEADLLGVIIAARAGYDPNGLVAVLSMLAQLKPDDMGASLTLSTHPSASDRLAELEKAVSAALERYGAQPRLDARFQGAAGNNR